MPQKFTRPYPAEYRAEAVRLVREDSRSIGDFASSLGVSGGSLRNWLKQSDLDTGRRKDGLTSDEREELRVSGARIAIGVLEVMRAAR